jgi:formimidoylglutamate deiminase
MIRVRVLAFDHVLTPSGWLSPGEVTIDDAGIISRVERASAGSPGVLIPGMSNLHSHAFQRALSGLTEQGAPGIEDSFWTWRTRMYGLAQAIDPDDLEAIAAQLYAEMLECGYTAVGEFHYVHHDKDGARFANPSEMSDRIFVAADETGIALTHLPVLYLHGGFGKPPLPKQRRFVCRDVDEYLELVASMRHGKIGMAPHSLRAVNEAELRAVFAAADPAAPIHLHVAEQEQEVAEAIAHLGARPVAFLFDRFAIDRRCTLVHATHVDSSEIAMLAKSGAIAGLCPTTEANLGDGVFPAGEFLSSGGVFGVGSDSHASVSVSEELRLLEYGQRLVRRRRNVLSSLYARAASGGAAALAQPAGMIAAGFRADLVVLDAEHPRLVGHGADTVLDAWIFGGADAAVREVMVGGRTFVREGRHVDRERIRSRFERVIRRLIAASSAW